MEGQTLLLGSDALAGGSVAVSEKNSTDSKEQRDYQLCGDVETERCYVSISICMCVSGLWMLLADSFISPESR